jgi:1,4-dihydroxy-2-naphthoate octaprenyltransferase
LGIVAIISAIAYTGGPFPLAYHGLGDLFVFLFFGLAAVAGTYYVQVFSVTTAVWWLAVSIGLLTVAILVVNNLRDIENDRLANKRTLAVRFGEQGAQIEYLFCILGAFIIPVVLWGLGLLPVLSLLVLITTPKSLRLLNEVFTQSGPSLNKTLAGTGQLEIFFALSFALGLILDTFFT